MWETVLLIAFLIASTCCRNMYNFHLSHDRILYKCEVSIQWKPSNADTMHRDHCCGSRLHILDPSSICLLDVECVLMPLSTTKACSKALLAHFIEQWYVCVLGVIISGLYWSKLKQGVSISEVWLAGFHCSAIDLLWGKVAAINYVLCKLLWLLLGVALNQWEI